MRQTCKPRTVAVHAPRPVPPWGARCYRGAPQPFHRCDPPPRHANALLEGTGASERAAASSPRDARVDIAARPYACEDAERRHASIFGTPPRSPGYPGSLSPDTGGAFSSRSISSTMSCSPRSVVRDRNCSASAAARASGNSSNTTPYSATVTGWRATDRPRGPMALGCRACDRTDIRGTWSLRAS